MQFMQIAMLKLKHFSSAANCKASFARKVFAVVKVFINSAPAVACCFLSVASVKTNSDFIARSVETGLGRCECWW